MSKQNRHKEYNRIVALIEAGNKNVKIPERLLEEFGKGKKNLPKENTDDIPEE